MAIILPTAPKNFYTPSLQGLKDSLEATNGVSTGRATLLTGLPTNIDTAWAEVGCGNPLQEDFTNSSNRGTLVIGTGLLGSISEVIAGASESAEETGYKLTFDAIPECDIYIDGSNITTASVVGLALIAGRDTFSSGGNDDVKFILPINNITVTDSQLASFKTFDISIGYAESI